MMPGKQQIGDLARAALARVGRGEIDEAGMLELLLELEQYERAAGVEEARNRFMSFVRAIWPAFIEGRHHIEMGAAFEAIAEGKLKRLIMCLPPRHTKSEFGSHLFPAWYLGRRPNGMVIQCSNTAELAVRFGRRVRATVHSPEYREIFPGLDLKRGDKAAGRWSTSQGGEYFAIGVGGTVTGRGADLLVIDDPHSEQEALLGTDEIYASAYDWYTSGPRQRLQPGAAVVVISTRWGRLDLVGRILQAAAADGTLDEWKVIEFPAILPSGRALWPEFWPLPELERLKNEIPLRKWNAQYQQMPVSEESAIVKREWWRVWREENPPQCVFIIQSWDTAYTVRTRSDFSACTTWGLFWLVGQDGERRANLILLDAWQERIEFPVLKQKAVQFAAYWKPDVLLIEAKSAGTPLIQELRMSGIPVTDYCPVRGADKVVRVNSISDIIREGRVWVPATKWAEEMIEQFAAQGSGEHDDLMDAAVQAIMHFRHSGLIQLQTDYSLDRVQEEPEERGRKRRAYY